MAKKLTIVLICIFLIGGAKLASLSFAQNMNHSFEISQAENTLNTLTTLKARFVQTASDGTQDTGTFYLSRPGKLRFEYDAPRKDFIVADGLFIYFYDGELEQQSNAPIGQTLADFFLRKDVTLSGDIRVTDVQKAAKLTQISLVEAGDPSAGSLILGFDPTTSKLKKWRIIDSYNNITEIELFDIQENIDLNKKLFVYLDPTPVRAQLNE